ncbi:MAG: NADH-quinone oxidoreductase subunit C [Polyangiaceae bacterium]|nr:NADH-quinone oxidoreductase subunit C [Polyangiaceae bacterium]
MSHKVLEALVERFGAAIEETHAQFGDDTAVVAPARWHEVALFLRDDPRCRMDMFVDLTCVDYLGRQEPRFEVVLHVRSCEKAHRVRLKTRLDDAPDGTAPAIRSVVDVWAGANWFERETYDMFGVRFEGHPDLRRILLYEEFVGHPLRKDYDAQKTQPLVPYRTGNVEKLLPFAADEGMPFGRQTHHRWRDVDDPRPTRAETEAED